MSDPEIICPVIIGVDGLDGKLADLQDAGWLQGRELSSSVPNEGEVYVWSVSALKWVPTVVSGGGAHAISHETGGDPVHHDSITGSGTNTHAQIDTHLVSTDNPHATTAVQVGAEVNGSVASHAGLSTGVHGSGVSTLETVAGSQSKVDSHKDLSTGIHGVGVSDIESVAGSASKVSAHATLTSSVHNFDSLGNAPAQNHDNTKHATAYATQNDLSTHTSATAPHTGHVQLAGQLGGSCASPDVRGLRETAGPTLLVMGNIFDGEYLKRSGNNIVGSVISGGSPVWYGVLHATMADCNPIDQANLMHVTAVAGPSPTGVTASIARCVLFKNPYSITIRHVRLFGIGATTGLYKFAIYPKTVGSARTWESGAINSAVNTWLDITAGLPITLPIGEYWFCVAVTATGTTAGFRSQPAPLGTNHWGTSVAPLGSRNLGLPEYVQFAVTAGAFPVILPSLVAASYAGGATGTVPFAWLDSIV